MLDGDAVAGLEGKALGSCPCDNRDSVKGCWPLAVASQDFDGVGATGVASSTLVIAVVTALDVVHAAGARSAGNIKCVSGGKCPEVQMDGR